MVGYKHWCFTLNNPSEDEDLSFQWLTSPVPVDYAIWQLERATTGTEHFQGYVEFASRTSLSTLRTILPGAHWERRRGSRLQAKEYASKEDTRLAGPFEHGSFQADASGSRTDLLNIKELIKQGASDLDIAEEYFGQWVRYNRAFKEFRRIIQPNRNWITEVHVVYGPTGTGKSKWALEQDPNAYWKQRSIWWDGYSGQETVVLDEFYGWLPWDVLLRMCDRYPLMVETKGGQSNFLAKKIIITTNQKPHEWYKNINFEPFKRRVTAWHYLPFLNIHDIYNNYESMY